MVTYTLRQFTLGMLHQRKPYCTTVVIYELDLKFMGGVKKLYPSPNIIRMIKSRRMRRTGNVTRIGKKRNAYRILVGKPEGKRPL
jgi:hypothetical protein